MLFIYFGFFFMGSLWVAVALSFTFTAFQELAAIVAEHDASRARGARASTKNRA